MSDGVVAWREAVAEEEEVLVEQFRFFEPSDKVAKAIMEQNQMLVSDYVARNFPLGYVRNEQEMEPPDESLLGRLRGEVTGQRSVVDPEQLAIDGKRLISERLYHYLSSLAETPRSLDKGGFSIWEFIPSGMATMLGLSGYRELPVDSPQRDKISQSLEQLSTEFRDWLLKKHGSFVTPWIEIQLDDLDNLRLTAIEETPDSRFAEVVVAEPDGTKIHLSRRASLSDVAGSSRGESASVAGAVYSEAKASTE